MGHGHIDWNQTSKHASCKIEKFSPLPEAGTWMEKKLEKLSRNMLSCLFDFHVNPFTSVYKRFTFLNSIGERSDQLSVVCDGN